MTEQQENLQKRFTKLQQVRDELKVQLNLGKMQARDMWEEAEKDFAKLEPKMKQLRDRGEEGAAKLRDEAEGMMSDIRTRFEKLRKQT